MHLTKGYHHMCVCFKKTKLSGTAILTGTIAGKETRYLHYRNTAGETDSDDTYRPGRRSPATFIPSDATAGALVLPQRSKDSELPAAWKFEKSGVAGLTNCLAFPVYGDFDSIKSLETKDIPYALDSIEAAVNSLYPQSKSVTRSRSLSFGVDNEVKILVTSLYTTIVARRPTAILETLTKLGAPLDNYNWDIARKFERAYPDVPFALNLFADGAAKKGGLLLTFEPLPKYKSIYHIPTLDGHGSLAFGENVKLDHVIAVATASDKGAPVHYSTLGPDDVAQCLPARVLGVRLKDVSWENGDVIIDKDSADEGIWNARRVAPHGLLPEDSTLVDAPRNIPAPQ